MNKVKIGMISFAHSHANGILKELLAIPDVEIVGIFDNLPERAADIADKNGIPYFEDHKCLLEKTDADAVVICSENAFHARYTLDAAAAGKHVLCEKPLGITVEDMKRMIEAARLNGVQLMTAFPCRFLPAVRQAKAAVERGEIGDILAIKATNRGRMPGRWFIRKELSGGGAVMDHTVHVMDLMNWFLQSEPEEVYAEAGTLFHDDLDVDDAGIVHVRFANGVAAVLDPSWSRAESFPIGGDITMRLIGTKGVIDVNALGQVNELYSDELGKMQWSYWGDGMSGYMVRAFVEAVRSGTDVPITGEDGLRSTAVALAAYESIKLGAAVRLRL
jgi:predicted dehydrogenase